MDGLHQFMATALGSKVRHR